VTMPAITVVAFALVLVLVILAALVFITYNQVVALQRRVDRALANIEVALKQRHDELPNLVAAVRGVLGFERAVLTEVTRLRAAWSPESPLPEQAAAAMAISQALPGLFAIVEAYPELKSQENVLSLQKEIERLEVVIAGRRELLNEQVYQYNATIAQVPAVFLAGLFGWRPRPSFEATPAERVRPEAGLQAS
jgi:LemA protein